MEFTSGFLQVFFAIILVIIFLVIGFAIYNYEMLQSINSSKKIRITTPIFKGIIDFKSTTANQSFNTLDTNNPLDPTYRNLGNSINQPGGAEFSYNFWLYLDRYGGTSDSDKIQTEFFKMKPTTVQNKSTYIPDYGLQKDQLILFTRGTNKSTSYNSVCGKDTIKTDVMVKCPLVKLENGGDVLTVEFNTVQGTDAVVHNARNTCDDISTNWGYMNSYKLGLKNMKDTYDAEWFMVTLIVSDTYPSDPLPIRNKVRCQIYINGATQLDTYVDGKIDPPPNEGNTILRQNQGNLYVNPVIDNTVGSDNNKSVSQTKSVCMADLTYMNYIPNSDEINALYSDGFTKSYAPNYTAPAQSGALANSENSYMNTISANTNSDEVLPLYRSKSM